jgi:Flp pilus assembly protein TadG
MTEIASAALQSRMTRSSLGERGSVLVEFAFVLPVLLLIVFGTYQFAITLNQYVMLTDATAAGARLFALSRGTNTPYSSAVSLVQSAAPTLTAASITFAFSVNGSTCNSDASCQTVLAAGQPATVATTYPCSLKVIWYNFTSSCCTLTAQMTERVE